MSLRLSKLLECRACREAVSVKGHRDCRGTLYMLHSTASMYSCEISSTSMITYLSLENWDSQTHTGRLASLNSSRRICPLDNFLEQIVETKLMSGRLPYFRTSKRSDFYSNPGIQSGVFLLKNSNCMKCFRKLLLFELDVCYERKLPRELEVRRYSDQSASHYSTEQ